METITLIFSSIGTFLVAQKSSLILIAIALTIEIITRRMKSKNKNMILSEYEESTDQENNEFYLQYYQKNQIIDFLRVISSMFLVMMLFVMHTDINLGFFAVAAGAMIMAFKDFILSLLAFFFVTPSYPIGMTVRVGGVQGQIIFIRMLSVGILGKDNRGENSGELFVVPSHKFITDVVHKQALRTGSIFKDSIEIPYAPERFSVDFETFLRELRVFLQTTFPVKKASDVGNFPSYTGHKYKLNCSYHDDQYVAVQIRFIGTIKQNIRYKEQIITFADKYFRRDVAGAAAPAGK